MMLTGTHPSELNDAQMVARARAGESELFEALMRRHNPGVYRTIRGVLRDEAEVEDAMQDAYVSAFTHLDELRGEAAFSTWIRQIALREALRRVRQARSSPFSEVDMDVLNPASPLPSPERQAGATELKKALESAIDSLPDGFREVFMLRSVDGLSVADTAELLGVGEETVKTRHFRARARLQETLASWVESETPNTFAFPAVRCARIAAAVLLRLTGK